MDQTVMIALANNAALLLVLAVVYEVAYLVKARFRLTRQIVSGILISLICFDIMSMPFTLQPGVIFDTRSILISVTALTFGLVPTIITVIAAVLVRLGIGGTGTLAGIAVIVVSALIGLAWRRWLYPKSLKMRWLNIYAMSLTVHIAMLACLLLIPSPAYLAVIRAIAAPVMLIYPLATILLSLLLIHQQERRQAQDQLRQSEERFQLLFNKAPLGYQSLDANGFFIDINQQWLDSLGYSRDEVIGRWFGDLLSPAYQDGFRQRFPLFKAQGHIHSEFEMLHKSGRPIFMAVEGKVSYNVDGAFKQTHCILQDITDRRRSEIALYESEEKYRHLYETMSQGIVYQDADGAILTANPAAEHILGLAIDQLQGKSTEDPHWRSISEDGSEVPGSRHPAMVALRTGKPFGPIIMGVFQPQINDHIWLSITATPLIQPGEAAPYQVYTTFTDITAEHTANQNYQQMFLKMVDAFAVHEIICDDQGKPVDYRFLTVNPAFERMTGLKAADILGKTALEVLPGTEPYWIDIYGRVALTGEPVDFENYSGSMGKYFEVSTYQPAPNQFACMFADITKRIEAEAGARESLSRFKALLDNSPSPIMIIDDAGRFIEVSVAVTRFMGAPREQIIGQNLSAFFPAETVAEIMKIISLMQENRQPIERVDALAAGGNKRIFENRLFPITFAGSGANLFGYIGIDVTDRMLAEYALKESEHKYSSYIENAPDGILVINENGQIIEVNQAASAISGYSKEEFLRLSIKDIIAEESIEASLGAFKKLNETGSLNIEMQYRHKNGSVRWGSIDAVKLSESRSLSFFSDITDKKKAEGDLFYASSHDYLTGLYNRRYFDAELEHYNVAGELPLSLIIGDINGLRLINDAFGRAEGDKIIIETARLLDGCCRGTDVLAKTGGDEFSILLPKTDSKTAYEILLGIMAAASEYNRKLSSEAFHINISLGFGTKITVEEDFSQVVKTAEAYLAQRKLLEKKSSHSMIISSIKATMLEKSHETEAHAERMVVLSRNIGKTLDLSQIELDHLELLATLHDLGKVGIADQILNKPGKLTADEWVEMKKHPEIGYRIASSTPELSPIAEYILCHHERWDGKGYPQGLAGKDIPLISRILAVVDAYDAMTQDRPYRKAMSHADAILEIRNNTGTQFDPDIALIFLDSLS